jgi:hypothetical protein
MRFRFLFLVAACLGVLAPGLRTADADDAPGSQSQAATALIRRSTALLLSSDSTPALRTCDPAHPVPGDFHVSNFRKAATPGLGAQVISGLVTNRCNVTVGDLRIHAISRDASKHVISGEVAAARFGSLGPGQSSPFTVVFTAGGSVAAIAMEAQPWKPLSGPTADLRVQAGATSEAGGLLTVPYVVRNAGQTAAILPSIAGRLVGPGCTDPFATASLNHANQIAAGETVTGSLTLPASCSGSLELLAGSQAPPDPPLPPGWSLRGAQVSYSADGKFRLFAQLCNNNGGHFFLFPAPTIEFGGAQAVQSKIFDSGYYPSGACQPLVAAFVDAPPGLTSARLAAIDTGNGDQQPLEGTVASAVQDIDEVSDVDWPEDDFGEYLPPPPLPDDPFDDLPDLPPLPDIPFDLDDLPEPPPLPADGDLPGNLSAADVRASAVTEQRVSILVYNPGATPAAAGSYTAATVGVNAAGQVVSGTVDFSSPTIPAHSWAVLRISPGAGVTGVAGEQVVRWLPVLVRETY